MAPKSSSVAYLQKQGLPQFIDQMITSLVEANPESPIDYLADWVQSMRPCNLSAISVTVLSGAGISAPKASLSLQLDGENRSTSAVSNSGSPEWGENFLLPIDDIDRAALQISLINAETSQVLGYGLIHLKPLPLMCHNVVMNLKLEMEGQSVGSVKVNLAAAKPKEWLALYGLHVNVVKGCKLIAADDTGFSDPYLELEVGNSKRCTAYQLQTLNPVWNEEFDFEIPEGDGDLPALTIKCFDKDWGADPDFLGQAVIDLNTVKPGDHTIQLSKKGRAEGTCGEIFLQLKKGDMANKASQRKEAPKSIPGQGTVVKGVNVTIVRGVNLLAADDDGLSDPYVQVRMGTECRNSLIQVKTLNPEWNERFCMPYDADSSVLTIDVWDKDEQVGAEQEFLGSCSVDCKDIKWGEKIFLDVSKDNTNHGKIEIIVDEAMQTDWLPLYGLNVYLEGCEELKGQAHRLAADSYVVVECGKTVVKTEPCMLSLEPKYCYGMDLKVKTGKEVITFNVWDSVNPVPILLGTTSIDISTLQLNGPPVQCKLDLGKDGTFAGKLVALFSPTERSSKLKSVAKPMEHPEFLVEPLMGIRATVVSAKELPIMDVGGKCDPFVELTMGPAIRRTNYVPDTFEPKWGEKFNLPIIADRLTLSVWDHDDDGGPEMVGMAHLPCAKLIQDNGKLTKHMVKIANYNRPAGAVYINFERLKIEEWLPLFGLGVTVLEGTHLPAGTKPFVVATMGFEEASTGVSPTHNAEWNQRLHIQGTDGPLLYFSVYDDVTKAVIGSGEIDVHRLPVAFKKPIERTIEIKDDSGTPQGEITVRFLLSDPTEVTAAQKKPKGIPDAPKIPENQMKVHVVKATLKGMGRTNCYAQLKTKGSCANTATKRKTEIPMWRENLVIDWDNGEEMNFSVWGRGDDGEEDRKLAEAMVPYFTPDDLQHKIPLQPSGEAVITAVRATCPAALKINVYRAHGLTGSSTGTTNRRDTYVQIIAGKESRNTATKFGSTDPVWSNEEFAIPCTPFVDSIEFMVYHYTTYQPLLLGSAKVPVEQQGDATIPLMRQGKAAGELVVKLAHVAR